jgi:hypothetical protein
MLYDVTPHMYTIRKILTEYIIVLFKDIFFNPLILKLLNNEVIVANIAIYSNLR